MSTATTKQLTRLYVESDMESPESIDLVGGHITVLCRRCPDKIEPNDDSAAIVQTASGAIVLVVADGVGGSRGLQGLGDCNRVDCRKRARSQTNE